MSTITSANSVLTIICPSIFPAPLTIQGYATDDAFAMEDSDVAESKIGVDGFASHAYVPNLKKLTIHLQADSPSISYFDTICAFSSRNQEVYIVDVNISLPSLSKNYLFSYGVLSKAKRMPDGKKTLEAQNYELTFESIDVSPM